MVGFLLYGTLDFNILIDRAKSDHMMPSIDDNYFKLNFILISSALFAWDFK